MNTSSLFKRVSAIVMGIVLLVCLNSCAVAKPFPLPVWETYQREIRHEYDFIHRIKARLQYGLLIVSFTCSNASEQEAIQLKTELQRFFSSEEFLSEYVPFEDERWRSAGYSGYQMPISDIYIYIYFGSSGELSCFSDYFVEQYTGNKILTVDGYQTWIDLS